jgi:hypothetical protein
LFAGLIDKELLGMENKDQAQLIKIANLRQTSIHATFSPSIEKKIAGNEFDYESKFVKQTFLVLDEPCTFEK